MTSSCKPTTPLLLAASGGEREARIIHLSGAPLPYTLRRSPRARQVRLSVHPDGALEVIVPRRATISHVESTLRDHEEWITRARARMAAKPRLPTPEPLADGRLLTIAGASLRLDIRETPTASGARIGRADDALIVTLPAALPVAADPTAPALTQDDLVRSLLERWTRREARQVFADRLAHWNDHYGYHWERVTVKDQKTRWGSCSRRGSLNFNWRLLLAPLPALDYVVIHELCHLKEANHGPGFWGLVAQTCPNYAEWRRWLRRHGHELRV